jgi:hypothetical protein
MSRTYRRRGERHDYDRVLRDYRWVDGALVPFLIDPRSQEGRRVFDHRLRTFNAKQLGRWLNDPGYAPCSKPGIATGRTGAGGEPSLLPSKDSARYAVLHL